MQDGAHAGDGKIRLEMLLVVPHERTHTISGTNTETLESLRELARTDIYGIPAVNVTGTERAYVPKGHFANPQHRGWKRYVAWDPSSA